MLSQAAIDQRKPLWLAFSDLFLDTNVSLYYPHIVQVCAESTFTTDELWRILLDDVAPVAGPNLLTVAGEWAGFEEEWLIVRIEEHNTRPSRDKTLLRRFKNFGLKEYLDKHWQCLLPKIIEARVGN